MAVGFSSSTKGAEIDAEIQIWPDGRLDSLLTHKASFEPTNEEAEDIGWEKALADLTELLIPPPEPD